MTDEEIKQELMKTRNTVMKALMDMNPIEVRQGIRKLQQLDHMLYDKDVD